MGRYIGGFVASVASLAEVDNEGCSTTFTERGPSFGPAPTSDRRSAVVGGSRFVPLVGRATNHPTVPLAVTTCGVSLADTRGHSQAGLDRGPCPFVENRTALRVMLSRRGSTTTAELCLEAQTLKLVALRTDANSPDSPVDESSILKPPLVAAPPRFKAYSTPQLDQIPQVADLPEDQRFAMRVVSQVLPFRVNDYVVEQLIDWSDVPNDPVFQLTFPQRGMLSDVHFERMADAIRRRDAKAELKALAQTIRADLNPHPANQRQHNVPHLDGTPLDGMQHKYDETVLFFPSQGQTCHSYCTFCFRWAQFIGDKDLKFASSEAERLVDYLAEHREVTDVLITGGDPMVMKTRNVEAYLDALLDPRLSHIQNIRIGSKSLTFWPYRYVSDRDADDLLRVFEKVVSAGKHLAFMAHFNHPRELGTDVVEKAVRRIRNTGAVIRAQAPLLRHINDDAATWNTNWRRQLQLGIVPYYMFVERDTGARCYFEVPLARAYAIYRDAVQHVTGLGRTVRGPSMSAGPGKVEIQGVTDVAGEKVFVLRFIQARESHWVQRPFFAAYDEEATWLNHLRPAFGEEKFFFQDEYEAKYGATNLK